MSGLQDGPGDYHQDGPAGHSIHDSCPKASPWSHLIVTSSHRRHGCRHRRRRTTMSSSFASPTARTSRVRSLASKPGASDRVHPPLNLRQYRGASEAATQASRTPDARMTALATATGLVCGVGAWRVKRARPVVALLAVIAFACAAHVALRARRQYKRDQQIDEASAESFPASDAPAISPRE
jgi:Flp pilus assembly protein TadB